MAPPSLAHQCHCRDGSDNGLWGLSTGLSRRAGGTSAGSRRQAYTDPHALAGQAHDTSAEMDAYPAAHQDSRTFAHMDPHLSASDSQPRCEDAHGHLDTATDARADVDPHPDTDSALFAPYLVVALHRPAGRHPVPSGCPPRHQP